MPVSPPRIWDWEPNISRKTWSRHLKFRLIDLILAMTVFFRYETHTAQESGSQLQCHAAIHSCLFLCLQRRVVKVASGLFCSWSLLRNNTVATNPQRFTLYYGSRWFVAWDCWTQTSWQVMRRDSDMLIAVSHVHLYFVKRSISKSIAMLPQVWKIHY